MGSLIFIMILVLMKCNVENFKTKTEKDPSPKKHGKVYNFFHKLLHILFTPFRWILFLFIGNTKFKKASNYHCVHDKDDKVYWMEPINKDKKYNCPSDGDWQTHNDNVCLNKHLREVPYDKKNLVKSPPNYNQFLKEGLGNLQLHKNGNVKVPVLNEVNYCKTFNDFDKCHKFSDLYDKQMLDYDKQTKKTSSYCN